ncbi:MAG: substrate-binding domain-containing protein, partial [Aquificales bacterium]|nr:substrate-binding domain-containing protein [Aquificales bacterium]
MDRKAKNSGDRIIIGLITSQIHPFACQAEWQGMAAAAREMDVNLVIYPGSALDSPHFFEKQDNLIYETVLQPALLDGLVIWTGVVDWFVSEKELRGFVERFTSVPLVSIEEIPLDGTPIISIGNYQGMWDLVEHLLVVHDYQRIAFVSGPLGYKGMQDRYQAYCDCLTAHGREVDAELVVVGDFMIGSGKTAVSTLLDERQKDFDAVVAANDAMALGVMQALQARGFIMPLHKAVVGFDADKTTFPPLTTVSPSFYEMGQIALKTCVALVRGQEVAARIEMPAELIVRRSCGCLPGILDQILLATEPPFSDEGLIYQQIATAVLQAVPSSLPVDVLEALTQAFVKSVFQDVDDIFLTQFDKVLLYDAIDGKELTRWHLVISALRKTGGRHWQSAQQVNRAEDLCHQARLLLGDTEHWTDEYQVVVTEQTALKLRDIGDSLITAFSIEEVQGLIADTFPEVGVSQCAVALFEGDEVTPLGGELLVMYDENGRYPLPSTYCWNFTENVLPPLLLNREQGQAFIMAPLHFREENLGVAVFGIGTQDGMVYETLRLQLSSALKRALMVKEIQSAQNDLELRVAARTSELVQEIIGHKQTA